MQKTLPQQNQENMERTKHLKNEKFDGQKFFPREHINRRSYWNGIDKIVLIWKNEQEMKTPGIEPYRIITEKQYLKEYKRFLT